jgi:hypothetical protein
VSPSIPSAILEIIEEMKTEFKGDHTRLRELEQRVTELQRGLENRLTSVEKTPQTINTTQMTLLQGLGLAIFCSGVFAAWGNLSNRIDTQSQLQAVRSEMLTTSMAEVIKNQKMSDERRKEDYEKIMSLIDARKGVKR